MPLCGIVAVGHLLVVVLNAHYVVIFKLFWATYWVWIEQSMNKLCCCFQLFDNADVYNLIYHLDLILLSTVTIIDVDCYGR